MGADPTDRILGALDREGRKFPRASQMIRALLAQSPRFLRGQLTYLMEHRTNEFWPEAERLVGLAEDLGGSPARALVEYTVAYLKEQVRFLRTREYTQTDFEGARRAVYDNPEVMEKFYLEGLMLTHAFWPVHLDVHQFFRREFLARVPSRGEGAECGFGHGLYLLDTLQAQPEARAAGFDISEFSRRYADQLLRRAGVSPSRYRLGFADVRVRLPASDGQFSWAIFAELLEHIPDPAASLRHLHRCLAHGASVFVTTVLNSNALDHLVCFTDLDQVRVLLRDAGFRVLVEQAFAVADYGTVRDPSVDVVLVCTPA